MIESIKELLVKYDKTLDPRNTKLYDYCSGVLWKIDANESSRRHSLISPINAENLVNGKSYVWY